MQTMNISLPDPLKKFIDDRLQEGRYSSASEFMRELIREEEKRWKEDRLEAFLLEGMEGPSTPMTKQDWVDIRAEAKAGAEKHRKENAD
jgi:antitoxin ParD1/3/4